MSNSYDISTRNFYRSDFAQAGSNFPASGFPISHKWVSDFLQVGS